MNSPLFKNYFDDSHNSRRSPFHERNNTDLSPYRSNSRGARLLKDDKKYLEEDQRRMQERLELMDRQRKYSNNVKELFSPTVDKFKQKELELRLEKFKYPIRKDPFRRSGDSAKSGFALEYDGGLNWRPRRFSPNLMVPTPKPPPEPKVVDYLADLRRKRNASEKKEKSGSLSEVKRASNLDR